MSGADLESTDRFERPREHSLRLFFAFWPDAQMQVSFAHAARKAVKASGGQPVPMKNIHLTLVFLGSVPESRLSAAMSAARRVATGFAGDAVPFEFQFERLEHWKAPQALCAVPTVAAPMQEATANAATAPQTIAPAAAPGARSPLATAQALAAGLRDELVSAGFSPDLKPFRAHVTLARKVKRASRELDMQSALWSFKDFALVESRTEPQGAVYRVVERFALIAE
ncbi:MAG TPA: 2'-5' RNA ligase family protein [Steroidobacteraceae bacterium]